MIIHGDCLEEMRKMADNSISAIVTDPPYGIGFMGKGWDNAVPGSDYWKACLRIIKPGGFLLAMGGSRTFHRLALSIEEAGFDIRDTIMWIYGSGFPKSHNNFGLDGYGTALKPAYEPIIMAMKPIDGTFAQNAEKWGQAGINIDGCRIGSSRPATNQDPNKFTNWKESDGCLRSPSNTPDLETNKGRWAANVIFDEEAGAMLDEQSGMLKSGSGDKHSKTQDGHIFSGLNPVSGLRNYEGDSGGASRFFYCAKASSRERNEGLDGLPDIECKTGCAGAMPIDDNGKERDRFKKIAKNNHPTVKPLKLMEYLIKLVMPPKDGILLDPFAGSGTTILAAKRLGFNAIGIEKQAEYVDIARARIAQEGLVA